MKKREIIFLSMIFILLFAIASASAADDMKTDGNLTATDDISVENVQDQDDIKLENPPADDSALQEDDSKISTENEIDDPYQAPKPAKLNVTMGNQKIQGETLEISYSVISNGEAVHNGDESNYVKIFLNDDLISKTTNLTGTASLKLNKAGNNTVEILVCSEDGKYDFAGSNYTRHEDSCNVEANPDARIRASLLISTDAVDTKWGDSITIYNNLTCADGLNCPDELLTLLNKTYSSELGCWVPALKLKYYLNGTFIGESYINVYGNNSNISFASGTLKPPGWYNFTAVLEDTENVLGCTSNDLLVYAGPQEAHLTPDTNVTSPINTTRGMNFLLLNSQGHILQGYMIDVYVDGVLNTTLESHPNRFVFNADTLGTFNITSIFNGSEYYAPCRSTFFITVKKATTYLFATNVTTKTPNAGEAVNISYEFAGNPLYFPLSIDIYINGVKNDTITINERTFIYQVNPVGETFTVFANYTGDDYREPCSKTLTFYPIRQATNISISSDAESFEVGSAATITVTTPQTFGLVDIYANGAKVGTVDLNETNVYRFTPDSGGSFMIQAEYRGTDFYANSTSNIVNLTVNRKPTELVISADATEYEVGNTANVTVSLTSRGTNLTGLVDIYVNGAKVDTIDLASGNVYMFNAPAGGTYTIQANYTGTGNYSQAESNAIQMTVSKKPTALVISADATEYEVGTIANITVSLTSREANLTGMADIYVNGAKAGSVNLSESNIYLFKPEMSGKYNVSTKYSGTGIYSECESNVLDIHFMPAATVLAANDMTTTAIDVNVDGRKGAYFEIALKYYAGKPVSGKTVEVTLDKVTYTAKTDSNGIAKVQINIKKAGTYQATVKFKGDDQLKASTATATIKVSKQKPKMTAKKHSFKVKKTKKVKVTLKTSRGKALKGKTIILTIKKHKYSAKTKAKGIATFKIKLTKKGKYTGKAKFKGDATYSAITKKVKITIK